jgi:hypothetical protein
MYVAILLNWSETCPTLTKKGFGRSAFPAFQPFSTLHCFAILCIKVSTLKALKRGLEYVNYIYYFEVFNTPYTTRDILAVIHMSF